jgi:phosphoribosyl-ATP pyrophosphohydrolase
MDELSYLNELFAEIEARREAAPETSYSAQLLADLPRAANKLGEEAVETVTAALTGSDEAVLAESADLIYHWLVVLAARGLTPAQVVDTLAARAGLSGLAEKAARKKD